MLSEILVAVLVVAVALLVAGDLSRTEADSSHGFADERANDASPGMTGDARGGSSEGFFRESAGTAVPAAHEVGSARRPVGSQSAGGHQHARSGRLAARNGSGHELKNWRVRSRLLLLVIIPAVAAAVAAVCVVRLAHELQSAPIHSPGSPARDRAIVSAIVFGVVAVIVVVLALWLTVVVARSVLKPVHKLRAGALEVAQGRLPDAIHRGSENSGESAPSDVQPVDVDSFDEIGDIARAFNQMRTEMVRLAANEAALRGRLDAMFVNLSHRSQSLVERQIRLIEHLEQGEQDRERMAYLFKMNRIASRMHRNSQNLLVLAGHEVPSDWNQPIALVNVIRAAVSEIEDYERVSLGAQPDIAVFGPAVNDVVHLLAELIENATSFSAGDMQVDISGRLLTSGGVLVDITDRGVGMAPKELAYANWRLENPPAADINVPKWMGLFVVARLAARHGVRVRLQQAEFGGLAALVWLPDEVITNQGAGPSRLTSFGSTGSRRRSHEAAAEPGYATAEQGGTAPRLMEYASPGDDVGDAPPARRPGRARRDSSPQPVLQAGPLATARPSGARLPDATGERADVSGQETQAAGDKTAGASAGRSVGLGPLPARAPHRRSETSLASAPVGPAPVDTEATLGQEKSPAGGGVIVPPVEGPSERRRLPIFDSVESHWFRGGREAPSASGFTASAQNRWSSPADEGWNAAQAVDSPSSGGSTAAGLPKRLPSANLVPGAIPSANSEPVAPKRSASAARDRFAGFQRGVSEARTAAGEAPDPGGEDES
ncbi:MAG TPA: HAMP domain-containing protein [Streptosporangiaceae bacterium]|jgi:signal transduction histidine kinase|nr:HAMP domain-containing protein [Streptosporangiaceae bacterium]